MHRLNCQLTFSHTFVPKVIKIGICEVIACQRCEAFSEAQCTNGQHITTK